MAYKSLQRVCRPQSHISTLSSFLTPRLVRSLPQGLHLVGYSASYSPSPSPGPGQLLTWLPLALVSLETEFCGFGLCSYCVRRKKEAGGEGRVGEECLLIGPGHNLLPPFAPHPHTHLCLSIIFEASRGRI